MKNILVPVDFSKASYNAAEYALSLAEHFHAKIILINAVAPSVMVDDSILASVMITQAEILDASKEALDKEIKSLSEKTISPEGFVMEGYPSDMIKKIAEEKHADLIVMGMKGKGKSNSVFGSTTTAIIRKSNFPVLVIPEDAVYHPINTITLATQFHYDIERERYALLISIAKENNSFLHLLNVQKPEKEMKNKEVVGKMREHFAFAGLKHSFHSMEDKNVIEGINRFIEENPSDVLAMMAHKHSFFERMLGKVHTREMSYATKIPLLVLQDK